MSKADKVYEQVMLGFADQNIRFDDLRRLLGSLGFVERIKSSHHIFTQDGVDEIRNRTKRSPTKSDKFVILS